jgi:hypothetical protein
MERFLWEADRDPCGTRPTGLLKAWSNPCDCRWQGERKLSAPLWLLATDADQVRVGHTDLEFEATGGSMNSSRCGPTSPEVTPSLTQENDMMVFNGTLSMSAEEWADFQRLTNAPWKPRTPEEFNAMCDLGAARHKADNTDGAGWIHAMGCSEMKFGPEGEMNFPADARRLAYVKVHGTWPSDEELREFEGAPIARPGLKAVD